MNAAAHKCDRSECATTEHLVTGIPSRLHKFGFSIFILIMIHASL